MNVQLRTIDSCYAAVYRILFFTCTLLSIHVATSRVSADDFVNEPPARRLYEQMIKTMHEAHTLSFACRFDKEKLGTSGKSCSYHVWLKKPNLFRMETRSNSGKQAGVLIGDGTRLWIHWPGGRPHYELVRESKKDLATRSISYMTKPALDASKISILHEAPFLGGGMGMPILDVNVFHGHIVPLTTHIDGVRGLGSESIDGHECSKIEVSILDGQRTWYLWLSKQDFLPRKLVEIVRVDHEVITHETWSSVTINKGIPDSTFRWNPPANWQEWKLPQDKNDWPKVGSPAPSFQLTTLDGNRIRLADSKGKVVWLNFWRLGCPPCVAEIPFLQAMHAKYKDSGLVLIGINVLDDQKLLRKFLDERHVTYLNVLDTSEGAQNVYNVDYGVGGIPMNCLVDTKGIVVDVWNGYSRERTKQALQKVGIDTEL